MKKKLLMIGGPMGVGKSASCEYLYQMIDHSVLLDGDWCWMMHPWDFSETNKAMVLDSIVSLLRNFLKNDSFKVIVFNWVLHEDDIYDEILLRLAGDDFDVYKFSLVSDEETLCQRLEKDQRAADFIEQSLKRLKLYQDLDTIKVDTTKLTAQQVAVRLKDLAHIGYLVG